MARGSAGVLLGDRDGVSRRAARAGSLEERGRPPLKIGLLLPDRGNRLMEAAEVRRGAEMAVDEARHSGQRVNLVVRTDGGNWGTGVRAITALAFTDNSDVLMGGVDSATAHLIEQIAMKARVPFLTPWASDYTLTRIGIPFMFLIAPDDRQVAPVLVRRVFAKGNPSVGILCGEDRSNRLAAYSFIRFAARAGHPIPNSRVWLTPDGAPTPAGVPGRVNLSPSHPLAPLDQVLREMSAARLGTVVLFGSMDLDGRVTAAAGSMRADFRLVTPMQATLLDVGFRKRFAARYHSEATLPAAYGYDSVMVAVRAARTVPNPDNHQALRDAIVRIRTTGVTGPIAFDKRGNRR